ncbi:hypothetical protein BaRGS_00039818 [Batillaria attramentaria]|uniref:Ig-like domain-containing protein n=1 Tax=Batillaria attramentaria TaxID=370345 RepID=A0ABD0J211_9CAEN
MAAFPTVLTAFVLVLAHLCDAQQSIITMNPPTGWLTLPTNGTGRPVEVTCAPPSGANVFVSVMSIRRVLHRNQAHQDLAGAARSSSDPNGSVEDKSRDNVDKSEVAGSIQENFIKFTIPQADCRDAAMYTCEVIYAEGTEGFTATNSQNLTVTVEPGQLSMTPEPRLNEYQYNASVLLRCIGPVGTVDDDTQVEWIWDYQESGGFFWTPVTTADTLEDSQPIPPGNCAVNQVNTLQLYVLPVDSGRTYRCHVRVIRGGSSVPYENLAAEYRIVSVLQGASKADVGAIVGGVIGALVVIVIVVILVYFLVIRKRRNARTEEVDPSKPADEREPYPYPSNNADVTYTKSNRFRDVSTLDFLPLLHMEPFIQMPPSFSMLFVMISFASYSDLTHSDGICSKIKPATWAIAMAGKNPMELEREEAE